jgi:ubiquinone biosynthesis UbiH/UbiF/VisC/COQ6 family hydroxylase
MKQIPDKFDVVVVGGNLVGATFALDLASRCPYLKVAILEQHPINIPAYSSTPSTPQTYLSDTYASSTSVFDSRIYAIAPYNIAYLERLGVSGLDNNQKVATINNMLVYGDVNSSISFERQLGQQLFLAKNLEGSYLLKQVYTKLADLDNVNIIHDGLNDVKIHDSYAELFGNLGVYHTQLVVAADGANSFVRSGVGLGGSNIQRIDYNQVGVVANFACELFHNNTAYQWFLGDSVLAYLPLPNNHISIVWACSDSTDKLQLSDIAFTDQVVMATEARLGKLKLITKATSYPLGLSLVQKVYTNRVVLIGDAAHTIHPLAGQGLNLGFADVQVLAAILSGVQKYQIGEIGLLAKYNNLRLPEVRKMQMMCHALQRLFGVDSKVFRGIRNVGLNLIDSLPIIKKQLIKQSCMLGTIIN